MNLHRLIIFQKVAELHSVTKAAAELNLSQPAVSLQLKSLEKEFDIRLLQRNGTSLQLTQAGEALYRCAVSVFHAKNEVERIISELREGHKGKLILGSNVTGGMYLLPRIVRAFLDGNPDTEISMHIDSTERLYEAVLRNAIDMVLVGGPSDDRRLGMDIVCVDRLATIASPSHAFAKRSSVSVSDLQSYPAIMPTSGSRTRSFVERRLRSVGVGLRVTLEMPGTEGVKKAVEANLGFGIVCQYAVEQEVKTGALRVVPIRGLTFERNMELVYRKQKFFSPVAQRFREFVAAYANQHFETIRPAAARGPAKTLA
jgi:DNA-binding transcriptional LysR family regulator